MEKIYPSMLAVRLTVALHDRLRKAAEAQEVSMSDLVREFIANRLRDE
jgi:predicted HicB family RNase H-like nuclease